MFLPTKFASYPFCSYIIHSIIEYIFKLCHNKVCPCKFESCQTITYPKRSYQRLNKSAMFDQSPWHQNSKTIVSLCVMKAHQCKIAYMKTMQPRCVLLAWVADSHTQSWPACIVIWIPEVNTKLIYRVTARYNDTLFWGPWVTIQDGGFLTSLHMGLYRKLFNTISLNLNSSQI